MGLFYIDAQHVHRKRGHMIYSRNKTKVIRVGNVYIGGHHPIVIQSMTNTRTEDIQGTVSQIQAL